MSIYQGSIWGTYFWPTPICQTENPKPRPSAVARLQLLQVLRLRAAAQVLIQGSELGEARHVPAVSLAAPRDDDGYIGVDVV